MSMLGPLSVASIERANLGLLNATAAVRRGEAVIHPSLRVSVSERAAAPGVQQSGNALSEATDALLWTPKGSALQSGDEVQVTGDPAPWTIFGEVSGTTDEHGIERYRLTRDPRNGGGAPEPEPGEVEPVETTPGEFGP